jgi:hypothetical protein
MKGSFCVSTVSFVGRPDPGSMAVVSGCTDWPRRPFVRPGIVIIVADADGADGIFGPRMNPDHPGSSSAFTTEGNVDTQYSKEWLRTAQAAGEGPRVLRPSRDPAREAGIRQVGASTQEVQSTSRPRAAVCHNPPYPSGYWIGVD